MINFLHDIVNESTKKHANLTAITLKKQKTSYQELNDLINEISSSFMALDINKLDRIGVYLHKSVEAVASFFASSKVNCVFVPINPILKALQVQHIIYDCEIKILITNKERYITLKPRLPFLKSLEYIIILDDDKNEYNKSTINNITVINWSHFLSHSSKQIISNQNNKDDMAAILYTSGSTGKPKGVVLSHSNIIEGAKSVAQYLDNTKDDNILVILPLSFDYGLSQLTTSFLVGANAVLLNYFLPSDVIKAIQYHKITGLAAVPPLWSQLCNLAWPKDVGNSIRYFTNSGGSLPIVNLKQLRTVMPKAEPYLMYGFTEAFRSTYLPPSEIDIRVNSIGKAIPNAEVLVMRKDGSECDIDEHGELVHKGILVSLGYWDHTTRAIKKFISPNNLTTNQPVVFSGDTVKKDKDGFLYFIARKDGMIKTSGYRVSPLEVEEILYQNEDVLEATVIGVKHFQLGEAILAIVCASSFENPASIEASLITYCKKNLANYLIPKKIIILDNMPKNANGKIDRNQLHLTYKNYFMD